jgi:hypothetical protein
MNALVHRVVRIDPLRILFVAVEHIRLADEALANQVEHVHHGRGVPERETDLGLESPGVRQLLGLPYVAVVMANGLLHQAVFAGMEGLEDQVLMISPGDHIDHVDVIARDHVAVVRHHIRNIELGSARLSEIRMEITDGDEFTKWRTMKPR